MTAPTSNPSLLHPLTDGRGVFAMLALDQRESLRTMMAAGGDPTSIADQALTDFKVMAADILTPHATAVLLDRPFGLPTGDRSGLSDGCALILAADVLHQPPGQPVESTAFDEAITTEVVQATGAAALKLLVMWAADGDALGRRRTVDAFLARCREAGVAAVVEAIVVPPDAGFAPGARDEAILAAARELSPGADLYKAQVPGYVPGNTTGVRAAAEALTSAIDVPWVVLSNGVRTEDFHDAVREACLAGASGFLAGRAIWADTVTEDDPAAALRDRSVERLTQLRAVVAESTAARRQVGAQG